VVETKLVWSAAGEGEWLVELSVDGKVVATPTLGSGVH
jgi:hypothetical protein